MPHNRFYVENSFKNQQLIDLQSEKRHLKVMRLQTGDQIELINGMNQLAYAEIGSNYCATIQTIETKSPPITLILCQAIPRLNRLDNIIEKGTELGMTEIWLFAGDRSEKKMLNDNQLNRLKQIAISSMKQCGRLDLPKIIVRPPLKEWNSLSYPAYFGDIEKKAFPLLSVIKKREPLHFFIGPEAGFSKEEVAYFLEKDVKGVNLHPSILRTDTAALVALSLISSISIPELRA